MARRSSLRAVVTLLCLAVLPGCSHLRILKLAKLEPQEGRELEQVEEAGEYTVRWKEFGSGRWRIAPETARVMGEGQEIGFVQDESGAVVAVAGHEQIPLEKLPPSFRYVCWYSEREEPTALGKGIGAALGVTAVAAGLFAAGVVWGTIIILESDD